MEQFGNVWYEKKEGIAVITLDDQPKLNALSPGIRQGLIRSFDVLEQDNDVEMAIVTGAGKAFCAGMDIGDIEISPATMKQLMKEILPNLFHKAEKLSKPLIAAVNGLALGGGMELAISCDIIIASEKAQFGVPEAKLGLLPAFGIIRLHEIVGRAKAKELMMTAKSIPAEEALRLNLVNKVVPHEKLMEEAMGMAKGILEQPRLAVQFAKSCVNKDFGGEDLTYATDAFPFLLATEDAKEGITAFMEKRKPVFKGR